MHRDLNMKNDWFISTKTDDDIKLRLFCFPYAGGNSSTYATWLNALPKYVEIIMIQPPGRTTRMFEAPFDNMEALVADLLNSIVDLLDKPYAFFGHSLGSRVAYELVCQLQAKHFALPECLIASASSAPHLPREAEMAWDKSDEVFIESLKTLGGTPSEFFEYEELVKMSLPMLRADFKISELHRALAITLPCQVHVLSGTEDDNISHENVVAWQAISDKKITVNYINGGHFYIDQNSKDVLSVVSPIIDNLIANIIVDTVC